MYSQNSLLDLYKKTLILKSDYQLARHWNIDRSKVSRYRTGRLKLSLELQLTIAETLGIEPLEIIIGLDFQRKRTNKNSEILKRYYFDAMEKTIGQRMSLDSKNYPFRWKR